MRSTPSWSCSAVQKSFHGSVQRWPRNKVNHCERHYFTGGEEKMRGADTSKTAPIRGGDQGGRESFPQSACGFTRSGGNDSRPHRCVIWRRLKGLLRWHPNVSPAGVWYPARFAAGCGRFRREQIELQFRLGARGADGGAISVGIRSKIKRSLLGRRYWICDFRDADNRALVGLLSRRACSADCYGGDSMTVFIFARPSAPGIVWLIVRST